MSINEIPIWEWIWVFFASISAVLHSFVLMTIIRAKRKSSNNLLKGPFFTIVVIQGIHELLLLATTTGFNRLRKYRIIIYSIEEDNNLVEAEWYWYIFLKNVLYFGHMETAANRLSAVLFRGIKTYDKIWNTQNIIAMTLFGYLISICLRVVVFDPDYKFTTMLFPGTDIFSFVQVAYQFYSMVDIFLSLFAGFTCSLCYGVTFLISKKNDFSRMSEQIKHQEKILLRCGSITFLIMLPTTIRSALELWSDLADHKDVHEFLTKWNILPAEAMCILQPYILLLSCKALRLALFKGISTMKTTQNLFRSTVSHA